MTGDGGHRRPRASAPLVPPALARQPPGRTAPAACSTSRRMTRPASPLPRTRERSTSFGRRGLARRRRDAGLRVATVGRGRAGGRDWRRPAARSLAPSPSARPSRRCAEHLADLHVGAILVIDAAQDAALRRADLDIDLVGLELDQRIAGGDDDRLPCFSHLATRASTMDSPTSGTTMFTGMSILPD